MKLPTLNLRRRIQRLFLPDYSFRSSEYWENRYKTRGNSGSGSYGRLAEFKAEFLNKFVADNNITRVLELGCGDGNQLSLANYAEYMGFDVAPTAVRMCRERFADRPWRFYRYSRYNVAKIGAVFEPDLVISLDVIFHLVEDRAYQDYMRATFYLAPRYIIIYASDGNFGVSAPHIRNWKFTDWVAVNAPDYKLLARVPNRYPYDERLPDETSFADFFVFKNISAKSVA